MKTKIQNILQMKQASSLLCWAAASLAVVQYYKIQIQTQMKILEDLNKTGNVTGNPKDALKHYDLFSDEIVCDEATNEIEAEQAGATLFIRLSHQILQGLPVIAAVKNSSNYPMGFAHALLLVAVNDDEKQLTFLDPGRPGTPLTVSTKTLLSGWKLYPNTPHAGVEVFSRRFFLTKPPGGTKQLPARNVLCSR